MVFGKKSRSSSKRGPDMAALESLYTRLKEEETEAIGVDGITTLCDELGVDVSEDIDILVIMWKFGAKKPAEFSKDEFINGMVALSADSVEDLKAALPAMHAELKERTVFRDFYKTCFQLSREGTARTIEKEIVIELMRMLLGDRFPHTPPFLDYLQNHATLPRITQDQFMGFWDFCNSIAEDLSDYSDDAAWPLLLDEYVEWRRSQK